MSRKTIPAWTAVLARWHRPPARPGRRCNSNPMMTDDDVEFWSDILNFRALLDDIHDQCIRTGSRIQPLDTVALAAASILLRDGFESRITPYVGRCPTCLSDREFRTERERDLWLRYHAHHEDYADVV